jgi:hypothetical protein
LGAIKPKGPNRAAKISQGHLCLSEENLSLLLVIYQQYIYVRLACKFDLSCNNKQQQIYLKYVVKELLVINYNTMSIH